MKDSSEKELNEKGNEIMTNFLKRFPATMKEVANTMDNESLKEMIKLRNSSLEYKKERKKQIILEISKEKERNKATKMHKDSPSGTPASSVKRSESESKIDLKLVKCKTPSKDNEEEKSISNSSIPLSDNGLAFNIFPQNTISEVLKENLPNEERIKLLEVMISFLKSARELNKNFHSSNSFLAFILNLLKKVDEEGVPKIL